MLLDIHFLYLWMISFSYLSKWMSESISENTDDSVPELTYSGRYSRTIHPTLPKPYTKTAQRKDWTADALQYTKEHIVWHVEWGKNMWYQVPWYGFTSKMILLSCWSTCSCIYEASLIVVKAPLILVSHNLIPSRQMFINEARQNVLPSLSITKSQSFIALLQGYFEHLQWAMTVSDPRRL